MSSSAHPLLLVRLPSAPRQMVDDHLGFEGCQSTHWPVGQSVSSAAAMKLFVLRLFWLWIQNVSVELKSTFVYVFVFVFVLLCRPGIDRRISTCPFVRWSQVEKYE